MVSGYSQERKRPSERRSIEKNKAESAKTFGQEDPAFSVTSIPEKWNNESAVLIHQKLDYKYLRSNLGIKFTELVRKRVKLLDKAAIKEFSEFYYVFNTGIQITKPDGTVIDVDLSEAVEVKTTVPEFYRVQYNSYNYSVTYKKIAIPNLTEGDIIDYFYQNERTTLESEVNYSGGTIPFEAFRFTMSGIYPVMSQEIRFTADRGFFINFSSYNGAPELVKDTEPSKDINGRVRTYISSYYMKDQDREKRNNDIWTYRYRENPYVKFQVIYSSPKMAQLSNFFLGTMDSPNNSVSTEELVKTMNRILWKANPTAVAKVKADMRKYHKDLKNKKKILDYCYYFYRANFLKEVLSGDNIGKTPDFSISDYNFVGSMIEILEDQGLTCEVVIASPKWRGEIKDILFHDDILAGLFIKDLNITIFPFSALSTPATIPSSIQGTEGICFELDYNVKNLKSKPFTIPTTTTEDNISKEISKVVVSENLEEFIITRRNLQSGEFRDEPYVFTATATNVLEEDLNVLYDNEKPKYTTRAQKLDIQKTKAKYSQAEEEALERIKENIKEDFDLVSYDGIEMINSGRFDENPVLEYEESLKIKGLINKAGRNYMFEVGKLIGKQIEISQERRTRNTNIYFDNPCILEDEVAVQLPAGYKAEGLEELNIDVDNEAVAFKSTITQEGSSIIIKTKMTFKKAYDTKENWNEWLKGLDAAQKFYHGKVVLKKA